MSSCSACGAAVLDVDVSCAACGKALATTGAREMIGTVVLGQYEIVDILGQGGMSVVFHGRHRLTGQQVALKVLPPELAAHAQVKSRFVEEARALAQLDHSHIVHLYNFGQERGCFVLAMQLVAGKTWERLILEAGAMPWRRAAAIACDVLRALAYAHSRGIIHRDMKPSNVLVRESDSAATVMDFGIAKMTTSSKLTATGQTMGTVRYMSPEQVRGHAVDHRSDLYSLGATLYEALVGETPFDGETHFEIMTKHLNEAPRSLAEQNVQVPRRLDTVIMRALAKKVDDRWQSAQELLEALEALLAGDDAVESRRRRPMASAKGAGAPRQRARLWLGLAVIALIASAAAAGLVLLREQREQREQPAAAPQKPVAFVPPDVVFAAADSWPADGLTVRVAQDGDGSLLEPSRVREQALLGHERFQTFLRERGIADTISRPPLTILVVPQHALCDARNYERAAEVPSREDCHLQTLHYRPSEHTLLIAAGSAELANQVAYGVALAICLHGSIADCDSSLNTFDRGLQGVEP